MPCPTCCDKHWHALTVSARCCPHLRTPCLRTPQAPLHVAAVLTPEPSRPAPPFSFLIRVGTASPFYILILLALLGLACHPCRRSLSLSACSPCPASHHRHAGLSRVIVPKRNMREVEMDLPASARASLEVIPVERLQDVLVAAFDPPYLLLPRARL